MERRRKRRRFLLPLETSREVKGRRMNECVMLRIRAHHACHAHFYQQKRKKKVLMTDIIRYSSEVIFSHISYDLMNLLLHHADSAFLPFRKLCCRCMRHKKKKISSRPALRRRRWSWRSKFVNGCYPYSCTVSVPCSKIEWTRANQI